MIEQDGGDLEIVLGNREMQRRGARIQMVCVDVGVVFQQQVYQVGPAQPYRIVERSGAQVIAGIDVGPGSDRLPRRIEITGANGLAQFRSRLKEQ
jgi:hypothetical protein